METTVVKHAVIVNTKIVTQYLVYVNTTVDLDGKVTNVIKVLNFIFYILMVYFLLQKEHKNVFCELRNTQINSMILTVPYIF